MFDRTAENLYENRFDKIQIICIGAILSAF